MEPVNPAALNGEAPVAAVHETTSESSEPVRVACTGVAVAVTAELCGGTRALQVMSILVMQAVRADAI